MTNEDKATLLEALDEFLAGRQVPIFLPGGEASFRISKDGGKTFVDVGSGCIGDIRIMPKGKQP